MDGIFVTNRNKEPHTDSYDGEEFSFPPNVRVFIPKDAAVHMLGWNQKDKTEVLVRLGWAMKYDPATKNYAENPLGILYPTATQLRDVGLPLGILLAFALAAVTMIVLAVRQFGRLRRRD